MDNVQFSETRDFWTAWIDISELKLKDPKPVKDSARQNVNTVYMY